MDRGWIKLYRKLIDNEIIHDMTACHLFMILLLLVDRRTGSYRAGRFQLSEITGIKPGTLYDALRRLDKKYKMATLTTNNKYTTISIVNWANYQELPTTKPTTNQQQTNTKQEIKNKESNSSFPTNTKKIAELLGVSPTEGLNRYLNEIYPKYKFRDLTILMVEWCGENKKTPSISRWMNWVRRAAEKGELPRRDE